MSIFGLIVIFFGVWWLVFIASLPFGVRHQEETETGHDPGAPHNPMLGRKAMITTIIATVIVVLIYVAGGQGWIDYGAIFYGHGQ